MLPCPFQDDCDLDDALPDVQASVLVYDDPEPMVLAPGDGAWLPALRPEGRWDYEGEVWPLKDAPVEVIAVTWGAEDREGTVLVVNTSLQEAVLEQGDPVASLVSAPEGPAHPLHFHGATPRRHLPSKLRMAWRIPKPLKECWRERSRLMSSMTPCVKILESATPRRVDMSWIIFWSWKPCWMSPQ